MNAYGPAAFQADTGVSRETLDRFRLYDDLLVKWQKAINLVGPATMGDRWRRHFLDSAQLAPLAPPGGTWIDLGSGAGFPGLVLAILGVGRVHLVESDARKSQFMREVIRQTAADAVVINGRIEQAALPVARVISARALAPLAALLDLAAPAMGPNTLCLFLKGQQVEAELTEATKSWKMRIDRIASRTDPAGIILRLEGLARV